MEQTRKLDLPQVVQHIHRRTQERCRIGDILAHHARASVTSALKIQLLLRITSRHNQQKLTYRFENSVLITDIDARNQAGSADQTAADVTQNVTVQIRGQNDVELMWTQYQLK